MTEEELSVGQRPSTELRVAQTGQLECHIEMMVLTLALIPMHSLVLHGKIVKT